MSASAVIKRKGREITRRRRANGTYQDGFYTEDQATQDETITACVQPMSGREKMLLPEGDRSKEWIKVWTCDDVRTQDDDTRADQLVVDGRVYEVQNVMDWRLVKANLTHLEVQAVSVNEKTNLPEETP